MMKVLPNILFLIFFLLAIRFFVRNVRKIAANIHLGRPVNRFENTNKRWANMARVALGQSKMVKRPIAGILHVIVYIGFVLINIELIEIIVDGLIGTHRIFAPYLGGLYNLLTGSFEILALLVLFAVVVFWLRRNAIRIDRFRKAEMKGWPKWDADLILYFEILLMGLFLSMNATDSLLQQQGAESYMQAGYFPVSQYLTPLFSDFSLPTLIVLERSFWWAHIIGIFIFLNYLYYSKHLHILLAFPNTFFANLRPKGAFANNVTVTQEVQMMMNPEADPNVSTSDPTEEEPDTFGAADVTDLSWIQLMNAYTCTECGRCTSVCPANQTGKKLSPRKIMMDTRDRLTEVGIHLENKEKKEVSDGKKLLDNYITREELWACTSCNACTEACPVDIDPLSIIMDMRQYLVMEESAAPSDLNAMMSNIENNGAPWPFNNQDRLLWAQEN